MKRQKIYTIAPLIKNKADFIAGLIVLGVMVGLLVWSLIVFMRVEEVKGISTREGQILESVNAYRNERNLQPLSEYGGLCTLAEERVEEIKTDWSHQGFRDRSGLWFKYCLFCTLAGENLARNVREERLITAWSESQTHREIMENPKFNIGCVAMSENYTVLELGSL